MSLKNCSFLLGAIFFVTVSSVAWLLFQHTNLIETKASAITSSAESINAAEEIQIQLLRLNREALLSGLITNGPHGHDRLRAEQGVKEWLQKITRFIGSPEEQQLVDDAERAITKFIQIRRNLDEKKIDPIKAYLEASHALDPALKKVNELTEMNLGQARALSKQADIENSQANLQASLIALLCLFVIPVLWLIVKNWGYNPIRLISHGIVEFRSKKRPVNIPVTGIKEIREIAKSFNELTEELTSQRRFQLRFLAGVAHDLKNPLSAIRMSAELLSDEDMSGSKLQSIVDIISRQAVHLERMVGDLLETSQIESGELEIKKQKHDIVALIRDSVVLHQSLSTLHRIAFDYKGAPVFCACDPLRINQVLNNLLNNAIKYSPNGGRIVVTLSFDIHGAILIQVSDEGLGIAEDDLTRVFEPFRRTKLTKETIPGVGLGLSVVKRIVEAHGGTIEVQSRVGEGTCFNIIIPNNTGFFDDHGRHNQRPVCLSSIH